MFIFALGLPLLTVILIALFSRKIGSIGSVAIACLNMILVLLISCSLFFVVLDRWFILDL